MRRRDQVVERPRRAPYCRLTLPDRAWVFRIPRYNAVAELFEKDGDGRQPKLRDGTIIARCWADEEFELEATEGEAVEEELYEAGWEQALIKAVAGELTSQIIEDAPLQKEVQAKLDFFRQHRG